MKPLMQKLIIQITLTVAAIAAFSSVATAYVTPMIGGGQTGMSTAPMIHADIMFNGTTLSAAVDTTKPTPLLRELTLPNEFDPGQPWAVLSGKAYNFQYAFEQGGTYTLPTGAWVWVEQLSITRGMEVYQRPPATPSYAPIFGTPTGTGTSTSLIWRWPGSMTHNVYAVFEPTRSTYSAEYRVYMGDTVTGAEILDPVTHLPVYGSSTITFNWLATPPPMGDANRNGQVTDADYTLWADGYQKTPATWRTGDFNGDGAVTDADYTLWADNYGFGVTGTTVPEPSTLTMLTLVAVGAIFRRRKA